MICIRALAALFTLGLATPALGQTSPAAPEPVAADVPEWMFGITADQAEALAKEAGYTMLGWTVTDPESSDPRFVLEGTLKTGETLVIRGRVCSFSDEVLSCRGLVTSAFTQARPEMTDDKIHDLDDRFPPAKFYLSPDRTRFAWANYVVLDHGMHRNTVLMYMSFVGAVPGIIADFF